MNSVALVDQSSNVVDSYFICGGSYNKFLLRNNIFVDPVTTLFSFYDFDCVCGFIERLEVWYETLTMV